MSGIFGCVSQLPAELALRQLDNMRDAVHYGGCRLGGTWHNRSLGIYAGWTEPQKGIQAPTLLLNEKKNILMLFSGENFAEPGIVEDLRTRGHEFKDDGSSYLIHLYEENTKKFLETLNGRFHGLWVDIDRGISFLFNDRYGMHRLYYHQANGTLYFSSEAKAILAVRPELRRLNFDAVGEFVSCGAVLENRTIFEGIEVLPPASAWEIRDRQLKDKSKYFEPREWEEQSKLPELEYYQQLRDVFTKNLPRYFRCSESIGMSLTGGLDTRMILANHCVEPGALPCYTFGSMFRENYDVSVARRVAKVCGQPHQVITAGTEFLKNFPDYASRSVFATDGCVDVSRSPDLYLNERASRIASVRMTGNYGSEVLRGVRAFKPMELQGGLFCEDFMHGTRRAAETYSSVGQGNPISFAVFKQGPWYLHGILALEQTQMPMRSPFLDNELVRTVFRAPQSLLSTNSICLQLVADGKLSLLDIPTDRGIAGRSNRISRNILRFTRELSFKAEYAYDMGMPQSLARVDNWFSRLRLERVFLGRHKPFHFRVWYRDFLGEYLRDMLLDSRSLSRSYINRKGVTSIVNGHLAGKRNYTTELHKLLTLELIHRLFLDESHSSREKACCTSAFSL
jgi:asparagine synthase (glutamine-hydrolysing)